MYTCVYIYYIYIKCNNIHLYIYIYIKYNLSFIHFQSLALTSTSIRNPLPHVFHYDPNLCPGILSLFLPLGVPREL